jgi:hypothetical protein
LFRPGRGLNLSLPFRSPWHYCRTRFRAPAAFNSFLNLLLYGLTQEVTVTSAFPTELTGGIYRAFPGGLGQESNLELVGVNPANL